MTSRSRGDYSSVISTSPTRVGGTIVVRGVGELSGVVWMTLACPLGILVAYY